MREWDGRGLPPVAAARLERAKGSGVATSLLSVPAHTGIVASGFTPVGEVMGCIVTHLGWAGYGGCGWMMGMPIPNFTVTSASSRGYFGFGPYVDAKRGAFGAAINRMLAECRALGGDGVVGVRIEERFLDDNREYVALGTAVRAAGGQHLDRPFSTTLSGQDVAKLIHSGYAPASIVIAMAVGIRHDDWRTVQATFFSAPNMEVPGYTDLVETTRASARNDLTRQVQALGASGAILTSQMHLSIGEVEPSEGHRDHVAEAILVASAIVETHYRPERPPLSIMPLR